MTVFDRICLTSVLLGGIGHLIARACADDVKRKTPIPTFGVFSAALWFFSAIGLILHLIWSL